MVDHLLLNGKYIHWSEFLQYEHTFCEQYVMFFELLLLYNHFFDH